LSKLDRGDYRNKTKLTVSGISRNDYYARTGGEVRLPGTQEKWRECEGGGKSARGKIGLVTEAFVDVAKEIRARGGGNLGSGGGGGGGFLHLCGGKEKRPSGNVLMVVSISYRANWN